MVEAITGTDLGEPITRTGFDFLNIEESRSIKYVSGFSKHSLMLSLAVGILQIFAWFKGPELKNYLKQIYISLKKRSDEAISEFPGYADFINYYISQVDLINSHEKSSQAFEYIYTSTFTPSGLYLNVIELGFRCIVSGMFSTKKNYQVLLMNNISLDGFRMLIFNNVVQGLAIHLDIYDNAEKESYKNDKIGEFPILNLYIWNSNYYLVYTEEMVQEMYKDDFNLEIKKGPFFLISTKKKFQPIISSSNQPTQNTANTVQPRQIYTDTTQLLKEIIKRIANELLIHNHYSPEFSKFIEECINNNKEISEIQILRKFINSVTTNSAKVGNFNDDMEILSDQSLKITNSLNFLIKSCSICAKKLSVSFFPNTSHSNCLVCISCAVLNHYCPRCAQPYTQYDRQLLRLP